jgi:hypothetical protein
MRTSQRGASLIEVLIASTVLITALAGVLQLVLGGVARFRDSGVRQTADMQVSSLLNSLADRPFASFTVGTTTPPSFVDEVGRVFPQRIIVSDAGVTNGIGSLLVTVEVDWQFTGAGPPLPRTSRGTLLVVEVPDAGF